MPRNLKLCCFLLGGALLADIAILIFDSSINFDRIDSPVWNWVVRANMLVVIIDLLILALLIAFMRRVRGSREWLRAFVAAYAIIFIGLAFFDDSPFDAENLMDWGMLIRDWLEAAVSIVLTVLLGSAGTKTWFDTVTSSR